MVCIQCESKAFEESVTPNQVRYGINIAVPALQMNRQSQRGSLKEGDFLPTVGKIETDKDYAFKQNAQMSSLGSNQPTMLRLEGTLKCEGPCSPAQPRGEDSLPWHAGLWALEQFSSLIMCASSPNSSRPIVSLPPLKADQSQRKGGQNGCRGPGAWSK